MLISLVGCLRVLISRRFWVVDFGGAWRGDAQVSLCFFWGRCLVVYSVVWVWLVMPSVWKILVRWVFIVCLEMLRCWVICLLVRLLCTSTSISCLWLVSVVVELLMCLVVSSIWFIFGLIGELFLWVARMVVRICCGLECFSR